MCVQSDGGDSYYTHMRIDILSTAVCSSTNGRFHYHHSSIGHYYQFITMKLKAYDSMIRPWLWCSLLSTETKWINCSTSLHWIEHCFPKTEHFMLKRSILNFRSSAQNRAKINWKKLFYCIHFFLVCSWVSGFHFNHHTHWASCSNIILNFSYIFS